MNKNMATILKAAQYNIVNIKWDTDGDEELFASLPQEIDLPLQFASVAENEDYLDEISDWLSKNTYSICGFFRDTKTMDEPVIADEQR